MTQKNKSELVKQIDYTKPKIISCSYFFEKNELKYLKSIFKGDLKSFDNSFLIFSVFKFKSIFNLLFISYLKYE